jgi:hypothetical protein
MGQGRRDEADLAIITTDVLDTLAKALDREPGIVVRRRPVEYPPLPEFMTRPAPPWPEERRLSLPETLRSLARRALRRGRD